MLDCIREVHDAGFLHRDIKPSNFARGLHEGNKKQYVRNEVHCITR